MIMFLTGSLTECVNAFTFDLCKCLRLCSVVVIVLGLACISLFKDEIAHEQGT